MEPLETVPKSEDDIVIKQEPIEVIEILESEDDIETLKAEISSQHSEDQWQPLFDTKANEHEVEQKHTVDENMNTLMNTSQNLATAS